MNKAEQHIDTVSYYLAQLGEECGEIQQNIGKCLRFGVYDINIKEPSGPHNLDRLRQEITDMVGVWECLCYELCEDSELVYHDIQARKVKTEKWKKYAESIGIVG
ncbi:MAG: hypothetical protein GY810_32360 [Aureispira sp.]|nr:hypothetical protein [Aureispira sp.]